MSLPPSYNLLAKYPNSVYIETGVWIGDSLLQAKEAGFKRIIGIDSDISCIDTCINKGISIEHYYHGNSPERLTQILPTIDEPVTFFLDAHWQFLEGTEPGPNPFPLLDEIRAIASHEYNDVVIIDDWHIFYPDRVGYGKEDIFKELRAAGFKDFELVANPVIDGILVAKK